LIHFLLISLGCFSLTAICHALVLRLCPSLGLLVTSVGSSFAVSGVFLVLAWLGLSSTELALSFYGTTTAFLAYQLFFFLGPATADRSMTAHLLLYLRDQGEQGATRDSILADYAPEEFLHKRFDECRDASLTTGRDDHVRLTARGRLLASVYSLLLAMYRLRDRRAWRDSFRRGSPWQPLASDGASGNAREHAE
jgi:hypothetical protein